MGKYTAGTFITMASVGALVGTLTGNVIAGAAAGGTVLGLAYMLTGLVESLYNLAKRFI